MGGFGNCHWVEGSGLVSLGKDNVPSSDFPGKWGRVLRWLPPGALPPKMVCQSTLKTCPLVWTLP
jgi:hypothetical protein